MDRIKQLKDRLMNIDIMSDVIVVARRPEIRAAMIKQNQEQLKKGIKTDGARILPNYSANYKKRRQKMGLQTGYVDLKVTGKLYENIDMFVKKDSILFFSRAEYSGFLENRYATKESHIYGLTDDGLNILKRELVINMRDKLGL
jgi:hypothetical protein